MLTSRGYLLICWSWWNKMKDNRQVKLDSEYPPKEQFQLFVSFLFRFTRSNYFLSLPNLFYSLQHDTLYSFSVLIIFCWLITKISRFLTTDVLSTRTWRILRQKITSRKSLPESPTSKSSMRLQTVRHSLPFSRACTVSLWVRLLVVSWSWIFSCDSKFIKHFPLVFFSRRSNCSLSNRFSQNSHAKSALDRTSRWTRLPKLYRLFQESHPTRRLNGLVSGLGAATSRRRTRKSHKTHSQWLGARQISRQAWSYSSVGRSDGWRLCKIQLNLSNQETFWQSSFRSSKIAGWYIASRFHQPFGNC